ncbi:MAG: UDP-3-O-(3-hydroxymyristoyl)glucosamine N-acyltransferase [Holosporales bacterium]|nr:UDP-3-O-(3-hydroxymyristoyl)glucosamine N-acyltransferase [Holosporales bacterium]
MVDERFFSSVSQKTVRDIADYVGGTLTCSKFGDRRISSVNTLMKAESSSLSFFGNKKYINELEGTKAGAVIIEPQYRDKIPKDAAGIVVKSNVLISYAKAAEYLYPETSPIEARTSEPISKKAKIGKNCVIGQYTVIEDNAEVGDNVVIGACAYIGKGVIIGNNCKIASNVHIECAILGKEVVVNSGACIGNSGFGIINVQPKPVYVPQLGRVIVGDFVRIGANTTIDRGGLDDTIIGEGTIIDNLVQIAHNVQVGERCVIVSQVGIAGSCVIGNFVTIAGQVGLAGHLKIGDRVVIAAKSGVAKDIPEGKIMAGIPAVDAGLWRRQAAYLKDCFSKKAFK